MVLQCTADVVLAVNDHPATADLDAFQLRRGWLGLVAASQPQLNLVLRQGHAVQPAGEIDSPNRFALAKVVQLQAAYAAGNEELLTLADEGKVAHRSAGQFLALDDEILLTAYGPKKAERFKERGRRLAGNGPITGYESLFYRAQRKVERRHFHDRKVMLYHQKERQKVQRQMGQDPYLDTPGA